MGILNLEGVSFSYDKKTDVVKNLNLSIEKGEYVCIIGHNGSGKSTLAKLFNGLLLPTSGKVTVDGYCSEDKKSLFEIRKRVGLVFQNPDNQLVASIVEDDVAFGPENLGIKRQEIGERIDFALKAVNMQEFRKATPTRLSGGQKQRIAIAGVLALKPEIIVLDESTAMLDPKGREEVLAVIEKLNKEQGVTVIAVTHHMEEVVNADRVVVLDEGEIAMQGTPQEIFSQPEKIIQLGLELPMPAEFARQLIAQGVKLPSGILTRERLAEELCKLR